jgi:hypothetical protein
VRLAAFDIGHKPYAARIIFVPRVVETLALPKPHPGDTFQSVLFDPIQIIAQAAAKPSGESPIFARFQAERPILGAGVETVIPRAWQGATEPRRSRHVRSRLA